MKHMLLLLHSLFVCQPAFAKDSPPYKLAHFDLHFPMACEIGETCWVMNYVDHDVQQGSVKDANCETRSYDGHKGTDIAIRDWGSALAGVAIFAPAPGTVIGVRDGEPDQFSTHAQLEAIRSKGRDCGNGVRIEHGDGWITQFCHMKENSVSAVLGDEVATGTKLGEVGMSGVTQHPHLHMSLIRNDEVIDPYTGREASQDCGLNLAQPLWKNGMPYSGFSVYDAGFATGKPNFDAIARRTIESSLHKKSPALVFYIMYFGARVEDEIQLTIVQPDGRIFSERKITQKKTRARQNFYIGRKNPSGEFMTGTWTAEAQVLRPDTGERQQIKRTVTLVD